ncbi:hypothetical protein LKL35_04820 [Streptomyces sp. ET3-23]|uniref:PEP/pyruvate-binding domain-containing protein n=1 Tax=Streptomyces sp. ET3-23 TaxID=2885643 RepID=UPI001D12F43A|nr:PEP/pyruvate-binding domain-containing protein [Streptomyces sp. ET3-23]MCC2274763.1 hypothetical protein [Streptomyces sp. ET3-23]
MTYIQPLDRVRLADTPQVGRKAAVLGELASAGFPVPDGFAVRADALEHILTAAPDDGTPVVEVIAGAALPPGLDAELAAAYELLGAGPVAVRSSGADEDGGEASFAGQFDSVLGVQGAEALVAAVRRCWASAFSERITAYRGGQAAGRVGVLVQRMVPAEAAGVAFTVNPVTGAADEIVVSAVRGLGDKLMEGTATPDEWTVRDGAAEHRSGAEEALPAERVLAVAALAEKVAAHFGTPQDIEWAVADGAVALLQARPVTVAGDGVEQIPVEAEVPKDGFWVRYAQAERPWTALQRSVYRPVLDASAGGVFAFSNGMRPHFREIGGWPYQCLVAPPGEGAAERAERIGREVRDGLPLELVRRWDEEWKKGLAARIAELRTADTALLDDAGLAAHLRTLQGFFAEVHELYFRLTGASIVLLGELGLACQELLEWAPDQVLRLRGGLTGDHVPATATLGELAAAAAADPAVRAELERPEGARPEELRTASPAFADAFEAYLRAHGHRTPGFELGDATLAEQPETVLNLVRAQLERPFDLVAERAALEARTAEAVAEAGELLAGRPESDRERFRRALEGSMASTAVRDEKVYYAVSVWALLRYAALEAGTRLASRGLLARAEDALHLEFAELQTELTAPTGQDLKERVRVRRGQHAWATAHPGPRFHGDPAAARMGVDTEGLSEDAKYAQRVGGWSMGLWGGPGRQGDDGEGTLRGTAASRGRYTGPARVITSVAGFGKLRRGDVLVCPETTAQWSVLFPAIGALVADRGSLLSHPAILAREYGIPAVVAAGEATTALADGQLVEVDGTAGTVRVLGTEAAR